MSLKREVARIHRIYSVPFIPRCNFVSLLLFPTSQITTLYEALLSGFLSSNITIHKYTQLFFVFSYNANILPCVYEQYSYCAFPQKFNPSTLNKFHFVSMHLILVEPLEALHLLTVQVSSRYHLYANP